MPIQTQMPALGYVTMGDYLGANKGVLDAGYQQDAAKANGPGLQALLGGVEGSAKDYVTSHYGNPAKPEDIAGYQSALDAVPQANEEGRRLASEAGLAGSGSNPVSGPNSFNAALEYGAHGSDYHALSDYLTGFSPQSVQASLDKGNQEGWDQYMAPREHEPNTPPGSRPGTQPGPGSLPGAPRPGDHR